MVASRRREVVAVGLGALGVGAAMLGPLDAFGSGSARAAQTASVTLKEYTITSPLLKPAVFGKESPLAAGQTTFTFTNKGKFPHDFTIGSTSPGGTKFKSGTIAPGKSKTITVTLKPGSYLAVCSQFNGFHIASGMIRGFSVGKINNKGQWVQ